MSATPFHVEGIELCGACGGTGTDEITGWTCPVCEGTGRVHKVRKGTVTVEPYRGQKVPKRT